MLAILTVLLEWTDRSIRVYRSIFTVTLIIIIAVISIVHALSWYNLALALI